MTYWLHKNQWQCNECGKYAIQVKTFIAGDHTLVVGEVVEVNTHMCNDCLCRENPFMFAVIRGVMR